jgi:hypothetical protein
MVWSLPEPLRDIEAQMTAMRDGYRDAVFVAAGGAVPDWEFIKVERTEGVLFTRSSDKALAFAAQPITSELLAGILGYPETKESALLSGCPMVVVARQTGAVLSTVLCSPDGLAATIRAVQDRCPPEAEIAIIPPHLVLADRRANLELEHGPALQPDERPEYPADSAAAAAAAAAP